MSRLATQPASPGQPRRDEPDPEPDPSRSLAPGTWTIDPNASSVVLAWRTLRLWARTSRLHGLGVLHLDALPPVGAVRFEQPSGLPVLTMALAPARAQRDPDPSGDRDVSGHRWWALHSQSLEVLPTGTWRIVAALTTQGGATLIELHLAVDPKASHRDLLVLRGQGVLDRCAVDPGSRAWGIGPKTELQLLLHATRVEPVPAPDASLSGMAGVAGTNS